MIDIALQHRNHGLESLAGRVILVIADFHEYKDAAISALVSELLREPPATLRVVISTRWDPDIPLSRLRIQGFVQDIRAADVRFDSEETRSLLPLQSGKEPAADTVAQLQHRTGG